MKQSLFELLEQEQIETEYEPAILVCQVTPPKDGLDPDRELVGDVRKHGVIEPLLLQRMGPTRYEIISGRRRYRAAVEAGRDTVPALLTRASKPQRAVLTMKLNQLRRANFVADIRAYEELVKQQLTEKEIGDLTGLRQQEIDRRKRLITAEPRIVRALVEGRTTISIAESAAKLPPTQQRKLMDAVEQNGGKLKSSHIAEIKTAQSEKAVQALPQTLFDAAPVEAKASPVIEQFAVDLWAMLLELQSTGCLKLERPNTKQHATNARIGATALIERIRAAIEQPQAEFSEAEAERLRQEALDRWRREPVAPVEADDEPANDDPAEVNDYAERGANAFGVFENPKVGATFRFKKAYLEITVAQDKKDLLWRTGYDRQTGNSGSSGLPSVRHGDGAKTADEAVEQEIKRQVERLNEQLSRETNQAEKARIAGLIKVIEKRRRNQ